MNFFIATVGRSGSSWLSNLLNKSETHTVAHEADPRDPGVLYAHAPFPIERFARPNYGEVNGFLRYHLSANEPGVERLVPRRGVLRRDTRKVITSWMNRDNRKIEELSAVMFEVTTQQRLLDDWCGSDPDARMFHLERLTSDIDALSELCAWLQIGYVPTELDMKTVVNPNRKQDHWFDWNDGAEDLLRRILERQEKRPQYGDLQK